MVQCGMTILPPQWALTIDFLGAIENLAGVWYCAIKTGFQRTTFSDGRMLRSHDGNFWKASGLPRAICDWHEYLAFRCFRRSRSRGRS